MERINRYFPLGQLTLLAVNPDTWSDVIANEIARIILDNEDAVHYYSIRLSAKEFIHREQKQRSHRDSIFAKRFTLDDSRDKDIDCLCGCLQITGRNIYIKQVRHSMLWQRN